MAETGYRLCPMVGFGISSVEPSSSAIMVLVTCEQNIKRATLKCEINLVVLLTLTVNTGKSRAEVARLKHYSANSLNEIIN
jgi:hypothetical protein